MEWFPWLILLLIFSVSALCQFAFLPVGRQMVSVTFIRQLLLDGNKSIYDHQGTTQGMAGGTGE